MLPASPPRTDLVLLGAGHAHVEVLRRFTLQPDPTLRLTLIGREPETPYSGMLPGLIRGDYQPEEAHIDLAPLAAAAGVRLILAEATGIDLASRQVAIAGRPPLPFDLLSINLGGEPAIPPDSQGVGVKPIGRLRERLVVLAETMPKGGRIAVVGGGPAGTELALALMAGLRGRVRIVLVSETAEPVMQAPDSARRTVRAALVDAGVEIVSGVRALGLAAGRLHLSDGSTLEVADALWATGVVGPGFLAASGLACDAAGCVRVQPTLESVSHPGVFAAGDCAALEGRALPKAGVWAVRAGPALAGNLRRAARGVRLRRWRPQGRALVILGLGGGKAVAWRNGLALSGGLVWRWKDWIDRRWIRMYQQPMRPMAEADAMRCGGCGAKVGAEVLAGALAGLPAMKGDGVLIGLDAPDDAAVLLPPHGQAIVQSVDHFRAFLDDPFLFGQIAAAHALSDLHAMGARPWSALAVAAVPFDSSARMRADLSAMLQGAAAVLQADGCALVGGHSGEAAEAALGFAVTGLADPKRLLRKSDLRLGDALVLTKPVGTGIVLAGHMRGQAKAAWLLAALASMRESNARASGILLNHGVTACTDVTGFGLAGHLLEMLRASRVTAALSPDAVPVLPGALELAARGVESTLAPENLRLLAPAGPHPRSAVLVDPQTSGGLLAGLPAERAQSCLEALRAAGVPAAIVGRVVQPMIEGAFPLRLEKS